ncbi:MAG: helix-hairpin-helix domain-containing protein [Burkholderiales bacterium]|nr:helix-hairpin-helix domain-containing protein [Burkholderiales bacterium]
MNLLRTFVAGLLATLSIAAAAAVDVNKASQAELQAMPGIGEALSTRIVQERNKAPFKHWGDMIERVRGVGPASAVKLSSAGLTVGQASYTPVAAKAEPAQPAKPARSAAPAAK